MNKILNICPILVSSSLKVANNWMVHCFLCIAEQINNLHSSKQNFLNWVQTIGECVNMPLSPNSLRYSK